MPSRSRIRRILLPGVLLMSLTGVCAAPEGILHPGPGTTVDGTLALEGMRIFGGETVRTPPGRLSELLTRGSSLRLFGNTKLLFGDNAAELVAGGVLLSTSSHFSIQSGCASVTPQAESTRYSVLREGNTVYVSATQNSLTVKSRKSVRLDAGKTVAVYCGAAAQDIVFLGRDVAAKIIMGAAAGATPLAVLPSSGSKESMSPSSPSR